MASEVGIGRLLSWVGTATGCVSTAGGVREFTSPPPRARQQALRLICEVGFRQALLPAESGKAIAPDCFELGLVL